jgi:BlaI family penicillinase repressor
MTDIKLKPTEGELDILKVLWEKGECSVREIHEILEKDKGYTTTLKQMQIMHDRGFVSRDTSAMVHIYKPVILQEQVQEQVLDKVINTVFSGSPAKLVMQAIGNYSASKEEMDLIRDFINNIKK